MSEDQDTADEWAAALEEQGDTEAEEDPWAAALEEQADVEAETQKADPAPVTQLDDEHNLIIIRNIGMLKKAFAEKKATKEQYEALIEKAPNFMFIYIKVKKSVFVHLY